MVCTVCHFETELDDRVANTKDGCICLRCYARLTDSAKPMPKPLRRQLEALMAEVS